MNMKAMLAIAVVATLTLAPVVQAEEGVIQGRADLRSFFQDYLAESKGEVPSLKVPAVWLFSPDGRLLARVDEEQAISSISSALETPNSAAISAVTFPQIAQSLSKLGTKVPGGATNQWTALVLSRDPCVEQCQTLHRSVGELQKQQPARLRIVDITLTF